MVSNPKLPCFIFDIDGTLADNSHRQGWVKSKPKNWKAYNKDMANDTLIEPVATVLDLLQCSMDKVDIIICTGREEVYSEITKTWLVNQGIDYDTLMMRGVGDFRDDAIVKEEMLNTIREIYDVIGVFDDRRKVVDMWRRNGCFVFDVNQERSVF